MWKDLLRKGAPRLFAEAVQSNKERERIEQLQKIIGQRQEEIDWTQYDQICQTITQLIILDRSIT